MYFVANPLAQATGFLFRDQNKVFLVTNRHNLTGRDQNTGKCLHDQLGVPDRVSVEYWQLSQRADGTIGVTLQSAELPIDQDRPNWLEHPTGRNTFDVAALLLNSANPTQVICANDAVMDPSTALAPTMPISVLGFPLGISAAGGFPIWVSGTMASEPEFDVEGKPAFYIDCRTNTGSSGSPVFASFYDGIVRTKGGGTAIQNAPVFGFLGIYSGRVRKDSDIGLVWRAGTIQETCDPKLTGASAFVSVETSNLKAAGLTANNGKSFVGTQKDES